MSALDHIEIDDPAFIGVTYIFNYVEDISFIPPPSSPPIRSMDVQHLSTQTPAIWEAQDIIRDLFRSSPLTSPITSTTSATSSHSSRTGNPDVVYLGKFQTDPKPSSTSSRPSCTLSCTSSITNNNIINVNAVSHADEEEKEEEEEGEEAGWYGMGHFTMDDLAVIDLLADYMSITDF